MNIGLRRYNVDVAIDENFAFDYEIESDLFDFEMLGEQFSWQLRLPKSGNQQLFNFPEDPSNPRNQFKTYEGFYILVKGNIWEEVVFTLQDANDDYYVGSLSTIVDDINEGKNKPLKNYIDEQIPILDGSFLTVTDPFNTLVQPDMCFPLVHFFGQRLGVGQFANSGFSHLIPAFNKIYLLRSALKSFGYTLINNFTNKGEDLARQYLMHNRIINPDNVGVVEVSNNYSWIQIGNVVDVATYIDQNMTLNDLIGDISIFAAAYIDIDHTNKSLIISSSDRTLSNPAVDLEDYINPDITVKESDEGSNIRLIFDRSDDELLERTLEDLEGNFKGEYDNLVDFVADISVVEGDYALLRRINQYWRAVDVGGALVAQFYSEPFQAYTSGDENIKDLTPYSTVSSKDRYTYQRRNVSLQLIDNGSGFVRLTGFTHFTQLGYLNEDIRFEEEDEEERIYADGYYNVTAVNVGALTVDLQLSYISDTNTREIIVRRKTNQFFPVFGQKLHWPEQNRNNLSFKTRTLIWHGKIPDVISAINYAYASCDPYDAQGAQIGTIALRFNADNNMIENVYKRFISFLKSSRLLQMKAELTEEQISLLFRRKIGKIAATKWFFTKLSCRFTRRGIEDQEIEGYKI